MWDFNFKNKKEIKLDKNKKEEIISNIALAKLLKKYEIDEKGENSDE